MYAAIGDCIAERRGIGSKWRVTNDGDRQYAYAVARAQIRSIWWMIYVRFLIW